MKLNIKLFFCLVFFTSSARVTKIGKFNQLFVYYYLQVLSDMRVVGNLNVEGTISGSNIPSHGVSGPGSSTNGGVAVWDGTGGNNLASSSLIWPSADGTNGEFLATDGSGNLFFTTPSGGGNISSTNIFTTDNALTRVDLTGGTRFIQQSSVILDDSSNITGANSITSTTFVGDLTGDVTGDVTGNLTGNVTGSASLNVLKAGDTMTGNLNMATQTAVRLQDSSGGEYVGLNAPSSVTSSYTLSFPSATPTANQVLRANSTTPTSLEWAAQTGTALPTSTKTIYVSKAGSDSSGDGSFQAPYASIAKAVDVANSLSSSSNPVVISVGAGIFTEDNSAGPIAITASAINIVGASISGTTIVPSSANSLFSIPDPVTAIVFSNLSLDAVTSGATNGILFTSNATGTFRFESVGVFRFTTGFNLSSAAGVPIILLNNVQPRGNTTSILLSSIRAIIKNSVFLGPFSGSTAANTAISVTGSTSLVTILSNSYRLMTTAISSTGSAQVRIEGTAVESTTNGVIASSSGYASVVGCTFIGNNSSSVNVSASGAGTSITVVGAHFHCKDASGTSQGTAVQSISNGKIIIESSAIHNAVVGIQCGTTGDTSSTIVNANSVAISGCTSDIIQTGTSTLAFNSGDADITKVTIADSTNVTLALFDIASNNSLSIGKTTDTDVTLLEAQTAASHPVPTIDYKSSLYSTKAIMYENDSSVDATCGVISAQNAKTDSITTDRTKIAGFRAVSDTGATVGGTTALRGWDVDKQATSAELAFKYQNSDVSGQSAITQYTMMQLDGVNNQLQMPNTSQGSPTLLLGGDTNLYRSAANTLKTDDAFVGATTVTANTMTLATGSITDTTGSISFSNENLSTTGTLGAAATTITGASDTTQLTVKANSSQTANVVAIQNSSGTNYLVVASDGTTTSNQLMSMNVALGSITAAKNLTTKEYVDSVASGINPLEQVAAISTSNITLNNTTTTVDGYTIQNNDRILVNGQTSSVNNGIYVASTSGAWSRASDFAAGSTAVSGTTVFVVNGTVYSNSTWVLSAASAGGTIGTDAINFVIFSAPGTVTASNVGGATGEIFKQKTANNLEFKTVSGSNGISITNNASTVDVTTNATSSNTASTIVSRDGSGNFSAGTITATNLAGTLTTAAQPNITSTGTLTGLTMGGTLAMGSNNITGTGTVNATTFVGALTGTASGNLPTSGGTLSGVLQVPVGSAATPALQFGATNLGLFSSSSGVSVSTNGTERLAVSSGGTVKINGLNSAAVVHTDSSGNLSTSLIVNADVDAAAAIVDTKLATISTAGKVANSATTATSANTASAIVARDASGDFSAGTITASLTGAASLNVLKAGDTMTGTLVVPAGSAASPSLKFTGSTNTGLSAASANTLVLGTNGTTAITVDSSQNTTFAGIETLPAGAVGAPTLVVGSSATTGLYSTGSGNLSATAGGTQVLSLASGGPTVPGTRVLTIPAGSAGTPSLQFTGSTSTGLSAATANTLSFDANGTEAMNITSSSITAVAKLLLTNLLCMQAIQTSTATSGTVVAAAGTSILLMIPASNASVTITMPSSPTDGQLFTIVNGSANNLALAYTAWTNNSKPNYINKW